MTQTRPDRRGYFGEFGGAFVPETLVQELAHLEEAYYKFKQSKEWQSKLTDLLANYAGRETPLYHAKNISAQVGAEIYLKREDLMHTGAHKLNNTLGQILLAQYMGKTRIIAETGAGQHGVATATVCALMQMECVVYMGEIDMQRQAPNVQRMNLLGATVVPVTSGSKVLKDAVNEALRDWVRTCRDTHYILGSVSGAHPFPLIVRDFQSVIGTEARAQFLERCGSLPDVIVACVGGGSNAAGFFYPFMNDASVEKIGVEAGGRSAKVGEHCMTLTTGEPGIFQGTRSYLLQDDEGQVIEVYSISAGLDYPGVGPEHSYWKDSHAANYAACDDKGALHACLELSRKEGIIPALESSHALGYVLNNPERFKGKKVIICLSGRGDKDLGIIANEVTL